MSSAVMPEAQRGGAVAIVEEEPVVAGRNTCPTAAPIASWPTPLIWKKILFWRLSWISLSSTLRESNIVR